MSASLHDKVKNFSVHIALLNPHAKTRVATIKILHKLGYQHIKICKTPSDLMEKMRAHRIDWVISTLAAEQSYTMLELLQTFYEDKNQHKVRFSFILEENELSILPQAFGAGLLSWFGSDKFDNLKSIESELLEFFKNLQQTHERGHHEAYVAAHFFRRYLRSCMIWGELIALEKSLVNAFPLHVENLVALAEAYFLAGEFNKGRSIVGQAQQLNSLSVNALIDELVQKFPSAHLKRQGTLAERFDLHNVLVIEHDEQELQVLGSALTKIGVPAFNSCPSFTAAWDFLKRGTEPDLIICEWSKRQGDLSTVQFLQRVRGRGFSSVPLMVMVSQLRQQEAQILHDVGTMQLLQKPMREDPLIMALAFTVQQAKMPSERKPVEQKIVQSLLGGNKVYAFHLRKIYHTDKSIAASRKYYVEALFNYHHGNFTKARDYLIKGIQLAVQEKGHSENVRPNLDKTVLLAKCLFRLGDKTLAIQMLEKARQTSPFNISILLALIEMNYDLGNVTEATAAYDEAEKIDAANDQVIHAGAKLSLLTGRIEKATDLFKHMDNRNDIIKSMNNQAVSFIQSGQFQRGVDLYQSAIKSLPQDENELLGIVYYNMALAFLRTDRMELGLGHLEASTSFKESRVHKRASRLLSRIEESRASGRKIKFVSNLAPSAADAEKDKLLGFSDGLIVQPRLSIALLNIYRTDGQGWQEEEVEPGVAS